jgi:hypothetical protein
LKINHTYVQRIIIEFAFKIYIIPSLYLPSSLSHIFKFSSSDRRLAQGGLRRSKLRPQAIALWYKVANADLNYVLKRPTGFHHVSLGQGLNHLVNNGLWKGVYDILHA